MLMYLVSDNHCQQLGNPGEEQISVQSFMDNNASERAIRGFCVGKKNWQVIDTINGAKSSAIIYCIAETAKANNLKP